MLLSSYKYRLAKEFNTTLQSEEFLYLDRKKEGNKTVYFNIRRVGLSVENLNSAFTLISKCLTVIFEER